MSYNYTFNNWTNEAVNDFFKTNASKYTGDLDDLDALQKVATLQNLYTLIAEATPKRINDIQKHLVNALAINSKEKNLIVHYFNNVRSGIKSTESSQLKVLNIIVNARFLDDVLTILKDLLKDISKKGSGRSTFLTSDVISPVIFRRDPELKNPPKKLIKILGQTPPIIPPEYFNERVSGSSVIVLPSSPAEMANRLMVLIGSLNANSTFLGNKAIKAELLALLDKMLVEGHIRKRYHKELVRKYLS